MIRAVFLWPLPFRENNLPPIACTEEHGRFDEMWNCIAGGNCYGCSEGDKLVPFRAYTFHEDDRWAVCEEDNWWRATEVEPESLTKFIDPRIGIALMEMLDAIGLRSRSEAKGGRRGS